MKDAHLQIKQLQKLVLKKSVRDFKGKLLHLITSFTKLNNKSRKKEKEALTKEGSLNSFPWTSQELQQMKWDIEAPAQGDSSGMALIYFLSCTKVLTYISKHILTYECTLDHLLHR